ncbi:hypothetical protein O181_126675 [Austropuccinia psidii MF-1]|uniref:Uncharacterized protein n=1 Tax=Austropuccinia psidii MF-1 TaxID=1389203 RepID=A0A9Q3KX15_9BASI|nr:hypothetical protein [Austropuccinia psidii MF-1]
MEPTPVLALSSQILPATQNLWKEGIHTHLSQESPSSLGYHRTTHNKPYSPMSLPKDLNWVQQPIITKISPLDQTPKQKSRYLFITLGKLDNKTFVISLSRKV